MQNEPKKQEVVAGTTKKHHLHALASGVAHTRMRIVKHGSDKSKGRHAVNHPRLPPTKVITHSTTLPSSFCMNYTQNDQRNSLAPTNQNETTQRTLDVPSPIAAIAMSPACLSRQS